MVFQLISVNTVYLYLSLVIISDVTVNLIEFFKFIAFTQGIQNLKRSSKSLKIKTRSRRHKSIISLEEVSDACDVEMH